MVLNSLNRRLAPLGLAVTVSGDPVKGRCLVATRCFRLGEVVLRTSAFATDILSHQAPSRCAGCYQKADKLFKCGGCSKRLYCSLACQKRAWRDGHKHECNILPDMEQTVPNAVATEAALVSRVARKHTAAKKVFGDDEIDDASNDDSTKPEPSQTLHPRPCDVTEMIEWTLKSARVQSSYPEGDNTEREKIIQATLEMHAEAAEVIEKYELCDVSFLGATGAASSSSQSGSSTESRKSLPDLVKVSVRNDFTVSDSLLTPVAVGCYPIGSLLNHSCAPNTVCVYAPSGRDASREKNYGMDPSGEERDLDLQPGATWRQEFRCVAAIKPGDEITHAYVDILTKAVDRMFELQVRYGFLCCCPRCPKGNTQKTAGGKREAQTASLRADALQDVFDAYDPETPETERAAELLELAANAPVEEVEIEFAYASRALEVLGDEEGGDGESEDGNSEDTEHTEAADARSMDTNTAEVTETIPKWGPTRHQSLKLKALELSMNCLMFEENWKEARVFGEKLVRFKKKANAYQHHPTLGVDILKLAWVAKKEGNWAVCLVNALRAVGAFRITSDPENPMGQEANALVAEAMENRGREENAAGRCRTSASRGITGSFFTGQGINYDEYASVD